MKIRRNVGLSIFLLLTVPVLCTCARKTVTLESRFKKGEEIGYRLTIKGDGTVAISGLPGQKENAPEAPMKMDMEIAYRMVVRDVDPEGTADIEVQFDNFKSVTDSAGLKITMEVDKKGARMLQGDTIIKDAPGLEGMKKLFEKPIAIKMDKRGKLLALTKPGELANLLPHTDIYNLFKQSQFVLPDGPVVVGQSWGEKRDVFIEEGIAKKLTGGKELKIDIRNTLAGMTDRGGRNCAKIALKGGMNLKDLEMALPDQGMGDLKMETKFDQLKQDLEGTVFFDTDEGRIVDMHLDIDQDTTMSMDMAKMDSSIKLSTKTKFKLGIDLKLVD